MPVRPPEPQGADLSPLTIANPQDGDTLAYDDSPGVWRNAPSPVISGFDSTAAPDQEELQRWILRTQIMRERITPQSPSELPSGGETVLQELPATSPVQGALDVDSRVLVHAAPFPAERVGWLD